MPSVFFTDICPAAGVIICLGMFGSSARTVIEARASRNLGNINPTPFAAIFVNCVGWITYAVMKKDYYIFWSNLPGLCFGLFFSLSSLKLLELRNTLEDRKTSLIMESVIIGGTIFWGIIAMIVGISASSTIQQRDNSAFAVGLISSFFAICYYSAPLSTAIAVIKTRNATSLYAPMIGMNLLNALLWVLYGLAGVHDPIVYAPNLIGAVLALFQLSLIVAYGNGKSHYDAGNDGLTKMQQLTGVTSSSSKVPKDAIHSSHLDIVPSSDPL